MQKYTKIILIFISTILLLVVIYFIYGLFIFKAQKEILFDVKSGESTREISQKLKKQKAISSSFLFSFYVYLRHDLLQTGVYKITPDMNLVEVASLIKSGKAQEYLVTIPEGWRLTQIDELLADRNIIKKGELISIASSEEGYLFPDTYHLNLEINSEEIKKKMIDNFKFKTANLNISKEVIIIASIVEREAKFDEDRAKIAGVYLSRLEKGMKLEADPTVQYAKGSWAKITVSDYTNVNSPYNTYLHEGLPPGPICNPGLKSILAALNPVKTDNLYFFTDNEGHAVFSKTLEEHRNKINQN